MPGRTPRLKSSNAPPPRRSRRRDSDSPSPTRRRGLEGPSRRRVSGQMQFMQIMQLIIAVMKAFLVSILSGDRIADSVIRARFVCDCSGSVVCPRTRSALPDQLLSWMMIMTGVQLAFYLLMIRLLDCASLTVPKITRLFSKYTLIAGGCLAFCIALLLHPDLVPNASVGCFSHERRGWVQHSVMMPSQPLYRAEGVRVAVTCFMAFLAFVYFLKYFMMMLFSQ